MSATRPTVKQLQRQRQILAAAQTILEQRRCPTPAWSIRHVIARITAEIEERQS